MVENKKSVMAKLYKRAMGYTVKEVVEEYAGGDKKGELLKRKITKKPVPPDISALKAYIELCKIDDEFDNLTDEDLEKEKIRLLDDVGKKNKS